MRRPNKNKSDRTQTGSGFLLQSLSFLRLWPRLTSRWGPSCRSPSPTLVTPPWAGRTATTHSSRSGRGGRGARGRQLHRPRRGALALHHDHLCRRPVGRGRLREQIKLSKLLRNEQFRVECNESNCQKKVKLVLDWQRFFVGPEVRATDVRGWGRGYKSHYCFYLDTRKGNAIDSQLV